MKNNYTVEHLGTCIHSTSFPTTGIKKKKGGGGKRGEILFQAKQLCICILHLWVNAVLQDSIFHFF